MPPAFFPVSACATIPRQFPFQPFPHSSHFSDYIQIIGLFLFPAYPFHPIRKNNTPDVSGTYSEYALLSTDPLHFLRQYTMHIPDSVIPHHLILQVFPCSFSVVPSCRLHLFHLLHKTVSMQIFPHRPVNLTVLRCNFYSPAQFHYSMPACLLHALTSLLFLCPSAASHISVPAFCGLFLPDGFLQNAFVPVVHSRSRHHSFPKPVLLPRYHRNLLQNCFLLFSLM